MMESEYCLYRHIRLDKNEVFYIGIGNQKRPYSKFSRNRIWKFITQKSDYRVDIVLENLTYEEACEKEKEFIKLYGRKDLGLGSLVNLTDGGTGGTGLKHTDESKEKMKGRPNINKNISKWNVLEEEIKIDLQNGFSERLLIEKYSITKGGIYRLKKKIKNLLK
jgi:hypothetical protein